MNAIRNIVVGLDFSPSSRDALVQAQRIAAWNRASLRGVHVVDVPAFTPAPPTLFPYALPTHADLTREARRRFDEFKAGIAGAETLHVDFLLGSPARTMVDCSRDADLLVMGTHSVHDERRGVGSIAAACVRRALCSVLLVRRGQTGKFGKVAVFVDFSDTSRSAVEQAIRIASQDGSELFVVHAYDDPATGWRPDTPIAENMPDFHVKYREAVEDRLRTYCEPFTHELNALKATFKGIEHNRGWEGYAWGLVRFVHDEAVDLAVLGTRSTWNPRDFLIGSTAERVVRDARCSIFALPGVPPQVPPTA